MITADEIFASLEAEFLLTPAEEPRGSAPAELFQVNGGAGTVGVIASVTRRSAVTATGCGSRPTARSATASSPARSPTCERRYERVRATRSSPSAGSFAMRGKRAGHGIDDPTFLQPDRPMSAIGG